MVIRQKGQRNDGGKSPPKEPRRKPYVKPQLTEYGQIEKLTQGGQFTVADGINTRHKP